VASSISSAHSATGVKETCDLLPQELSKISKKPVAVHECGFKQVGNTKGLYVVADPYEGEKYVQYMVQKGSEQVLLFTATAKSQDFGAMKSEFDKMMKSFELM